MKELSFFCVRHTGGRLAILTTHPCQLHWCSLWKQRHAFDFTVFSGHNKNYICVLWNVTHVCRRCSMYELELACTWKRSISFFNYTTHLQRMDRLNVVPTSLTFLSFLRNFILRWREQALESFVLVLFTISTLLSLLVRYSCNFLLCEVQKKIYLTVYLFD